MNDEMNTSGNGGGEATQTKDNKSAIAISKKSFITAIIIILVLMVASFIMTFVMDGMSYTVDEVTGEYEFVNEGRQGLAWWKFLLSPFLVLSPSSDGYMTIILIIVLLLLIAGVFNTLEKTGILKYMLKRTVNRFKNKRYLLLAIISFMFMVLGSCVGMFEEAVPLVPIVVMLCYSMGWDSFTGLGASLLAVCCGFAAGVLNPFTVGVAQEIGGLAMFSGIGMRLISFAVIYGILVAFLILYAKRIEKNPKKSKVYNEDLTAKEALVAEQDEVFVRDARMDKGLRWFLIWMGVMVLGVVLSIPIKALSDYIMYIIILCYVIAGIGAAAFCGYKPKEIGKNFGKGIVGILPAILMILMAASVKYILYESNLMYAILYHAMNAIKKAPGELAVLLIYLVVLLFNFFIPSGSAKAALLMPTIYPLADMLGIHRQTAVLAFAYGDGFSNVLFPTNPVLLITLGLTVVSFTKWFRWSVKVQLLFFIATAGLLLFAHAVIYPVGA